VKLTQQSQDGTILHTLTSDDEVLGYVAIDTTVDGKSSGGLRMLPDVDGDEVVGLARAMTAKYGFLGLPQGGAKAGVLGDPEAPAAERRALLARFAHGIRDLLRGGTFVPYADMGTCGEDIGAMLRSVGLRPSKKSVEDHDSGSYTAVSVAASATAALAWLSLRSSGCRVAIEGFGKVAAPLARRLHQAGFKVVAVSTRLGGIYDPDGLDVPVLLDLSARLGSAMVHAYPKATRLAPSELLELPAEVLCPCARHDRITATNVERVQCRIISPGANNPVTPDAERILESRGVICIPDFVSNCGGVLGGTMEFAGMTSPRIIEMIDTGTAQAVHRLLDTAKARAVPPRALAEELSRARREALQHAARHPTPLSRLLASGLTAYRRGLVSRHIVGLLAPAFFRRLPFYREP
jgi:glutamate dehydrogenase (NAD(P)+)